MRTPDRTGTARILCLALFLGFLLQNAFADQPADSRARSAQAITHVQDIPAGTIQQPPGKSADRPLHSGIISAGALVSPVTAPHFFPPSTSAQASPPLSSLLTFSQYVTSQL